MDIVTVVTSIATIALSGVISTVVTYRLNVRKDRDVFMRQKAEELYRSFDKYDHDLGGHFLAYIPLLDGLIDYNKFLDQKIESGRSPSGTKDALTQTEMLTGIYFPQLEPTLKSYLKFRDEMHGFLSRHKEAYRNGPIRNTRREWSDPFAKLLLELGELEVGFKKSIIVEAQKYNSALRWKKK
jgi:hypothetical protein